MINVARIKALFPESMLNDDYSIPIPLINDKTRQETHKHFEY